MAIRTRFDPLRNHIGVEQVIHSSIGCGALLARLIFSPELRSGEAAKKSARGPTRSVFRRHSSGETTTAAVLPFLVMDCGPRACALSMTSLNLALASATVQFRSDMTRLRKMSTMTILLIRRGCKPTLQFHSAQS